MEENTWEREKAREQQLGAGPRLMYVRRNAAAMQSWFDAQYTTAAEWRERDGRREGYSFHKKKKVPVPRPKQSVA
jgi:hypothetical protein